MSVTLKQIAAELNVSQPLVTYALNGKPGVSPQMRQAIIETAERLGYHKYSNREARMLAARKYGRKAATGMVALIFPRFGDTPWTAVPYFRAMVDGVEYEAGLRGLDLVIAPYRQEYALPRIVQEGGVDGVIFLSAPVDPDAVAQMAMPMVSMGAECFTGHCFLPDDKAGIRLAIEHLYKLGHRHIAYLSASATISSARTRGEAYRSTLDELGLPVDEALIEDTGNSGREGGKEAMARLMQTDSVDGTPRFTALVCHNDLIAMGAVDYAHSIGLRVPADLSVVGFDDVSPDYNFQPALTSIAFGRFEMGRGAIELICAEVESQYQAGAPQTNGDAPDQHSHVSNRIFPVELVVRKSSGHLHTSLNSQGKGGTEVGQSRTGVHPG